MRAEVYPVKTPEAMGVRSLAIDGAIKSIREEHGLELHSFLMLRGGALIHESYFRDNEAERLHTLYSVSKSFMSTAVGLAQAEGALCLDDLLYGFFPEHAALCDSERKRRVTLRHMLMMSGGFENNEVRIFGNKTDLLKNALSQPVIHEPGTVFNYYTLGSYLLSAAFQRVRPEGIHAYLKRKLFAPMQITRSRWSKSSEKIDLGGFGLSLSAYDMTKLGQLYLQNGNWEGQQLLPQSWAREATAKQMDNDRPEASADWRKGYGYQFWRNGFGGFRADGMFGQYIVVLPEKEAVIVMTGNLNDMQIPLCAVAEILLRGTS
ncbi:MAG: beta-lactamase family protein [Clostridia bacterium]|nr:beta-lactamase family protein [Clostridia bacterium]